MSKNCIHKNINKILIILFFIFNSGILLASISLAPVSGSIIWLDANDIDGDGDDTNNQNNLIIKKWIDKSGNGNNLSNIDLDNSVVYKKSQQNSLSTMYFTGGNILSNKQVSGVNTYGYTKFIVFKRDFKVGYPDKYIELMSVFNKTLQSENNKSILGIENKRITSKHNNEAVLHNVNTISIDKFYITSMRYDVSTNSLDNKIIVNGVTDIGNDHPYTFNINSISLGGNGFKGHMAEVLIYDRALSDNEVGCVNKYLSNKWNIDSNSFCITTKKAHKVLENTTDIIKIEVDANKNSTSVLSLKDGADSSFFTLSSDGILKFKIAPDFENPAGRNKDRTNRNLANLYTIGVKASNSLAPPVTKFFAIKVGNILENTITATNEHRYINVDAINNDNVGDILSTTGAPTSFVIESSDQNPAFKINNLGQIQVNNNSKIGTVKTIHTLTIKISKTDAKTETILVSIIIDPELDTDGDGISDRWEDDHGLDKNVDDANQDNDNNGVTNIDEFESRTDLESPIIIFKSDNIELKAKGRRTQFSVDDFVESSYDSRDDKYITPTTINDLLLTSGTHSITWKAEDRAGNIATETQNIKVKPIVNFYPKQMGSKDQILTITASLSGRAATYPVSIPFVISGGGGDDYNLESNTIVINSGLVGTTTIGLLVDSDKTLTLNMDNPINAVKGQNSVHKIIILESINNKPPEIRNFIVKQDLLEGRIIINTGTPVVVVANVFDPNNDTLTYAWSINGRQYVNNSNTFAFYPEKKLNLKLSVTDNEFTTVQELYLKVITTPLTYGTIDQNLDTDKDGILDKDEAGDKNNNGILDYKEHKDIAQYKEILSLGVDVFRTIISQPGVQILTGKITNESGELTKIRLKEYLAENNISDNSEDEFITMNMYDYIIDGVERGGTASVVIELINPILENSVLRKYSIDKGWQNFIINNNNTFATQVSNDCSGIWQEERLIAGATCLKLIIEDGGENDADGRANGSIEDPVAIASADSSSSGGGCVYNPNAKGFDIIFILMMLFSFYYFTQKKAIIEK